MAARLRIGVLGLGGRWPRYRTALLTSPREIRLVALYDSSLERAEQEAKELNCISISGVLELLERSDVDAILVPGQLWHGLWSVEQGVRFAKPILLDQGSLKDKVDLQTIPPCSPSSIHVAFWPKLTLLAEEVICRMEQALGEVHFLQITHTHPQRDALSSPSLLALLHLSAKLFDDLPQSVSAACVGASLQITLIFPRMRIAQLTFWRHVHSLPGCRLHVEAERGSLRAELPSRLEWLDGDGRHMLELPRTQPERLTLYRFVQAVRKQSEPSCGLFEITQALHWREMVQRSIEFGKPLDLR